MVVEMVLMVTVIVLMGVVEMAIKIKRKLEVTM